MVAQASRAYICGSGRIVQLRREEWKLAPGGRSVRFPGTYCSRDELWTGDLVVEWVTPEQVAPRTSSPYGA
ncbi:hypothetical protein [Streptomyces sp. NPDC086023]|uniref:hypothetical protein n=1 Tax=Streptomyces sp. NPDC086023 TaxID=3365746 RepID=UPI0037D5DE38